MEESSVEKLSESDLRMLKAANDGLAMAQSISQFTHSHLAREYKLKETDIVDSQGVIIRSKGPVNDDTTQ